VVEGYLWSTLARHISLVWTYPDPVDFAIDSVGLRFGTYAANSDDSSVVPAPELSHAVVYPKTPCGTRIAVVGAFVDQDSHVDDYTAFDVDGYHMLLQLKASKSSVRFQPLASARGLFGGRESLVRTTIRRLKAGGYQR
jgi:hypothetical protein